MGAVESNVEIARRGYEAALAGDLDSVREFLDPDVRWHGGDPDAPGACRSREEALKVMGRPSVEPSWSRSSVTATKWS
jgi:ketosteroid isomerase-like protein